MNKNLLIIYPENDEYKQKIVQVLEDNPQLISGDWQADDDRILIYPSNRIQDKLRKVLNTDHYIIYTSDEFSNFSNYYLHDNKYEGEYAPDEESCFFIYDNKPVSDKNLLNILKAKLHGQEPIVEDEYAIYIQEKGTIQVAKELLLNSNEYLTWLAKRGNE